EKVPFLHEVFDTVDRRVGINIELKSADTAEPVMELVDHYIQNHGWSIDDFMISSFNHFELKTVRKINPDINIGILLYGVPLDFDAIMQLIRPNSINISIDFISQSIVNIIHEKDLNVFVYTVNYADEIRWMLDLDVNGVFTDYPDRIMAIISK
ncbi:MAG: glycerophosphodiester phosphodiesterase, partial [Bacteroidota bacterium]